MGRPLPKPTPVRLGVRRARPAARPNAYVTYGRGLAVLTLILGVLLVVGGGWSPYPAWLVVANGLALILFRHDKRQAQRAGATRVPEAILLMLLVAGGAAGGAVGMLLPPRHKTRKPLFWTALIVGTALAIFLWPRLTSP